jgi:tellurite methyltransferase
MDRAIIGFHQDEEGNWVADLDCGHRQHLYHRPPFQLRSWVLTEHGRSSRLGTALACPLCERAELPERVRLLRGSPQWDQHSMPERLRQRDRLPRGVWGLLGVSEGELRVWLGTSPPRALTLPVGSTQVIPPLVEYEIEPVGEARFELDMLQADTQVGSEVGAGDTEDVGGDPACWARLICPDCGAMLPGGHRLGCEEERGSFHPTEG